MDIENLSNLIATLVCEMVSNPKRVKVVCRTLERSNTVQIDVDPSEVGRVIGEAGSHFKALSKICLSFSAKLGKHCELLPMEEPDEDVVPSRYGRFKGRDDWPKEKISQLVERVARNVFKHEDAIEVTVKDEEHFVSVFTVKVARTEDSDVVNLMSDAYKPIFNAIGRMNGRVLIVDVVAGKSAAKPEKQPSTADGRFAREIRR